MSLSVHEYAHERPHARMQVFVRVFWLLLTCLYVSLWVDCPWFCCAQCFKPVLLCFTIKAHCVFDRFTDLLKPTGKMLDAMADRDPMSNIFSLHAMLEQQQVEFFILSYSTVEAFES